MNLSIRDATRADLPQLAALYAASGLDAAELNDEATIAAAWDRMVRETPTARVLIAEQAGVAVGTLTCYVLPMLLHGGARAALVEAVAVDARVQGQGLGRALMDAAMEIAQTSGCYKLALSSNRRRDEAHAFYEGLGYERHGVSFVAHLEEPAA